MRSGAQLTVMTLVTMHYATSGSGQRNGTHHWQHTLLCLPVSWEADSTYMLTQTPLCSSSSHTTSATSARLILAGVPITRLQPKLDQSNQGKSAAPLPGPLWKYGASSHPSGRFQRQRRDYDSYYHHLRCGWGSPRWSYLRLREEIEPQSLCSFQEQETPGKETRPHRSIQLISTSSE